MLGSIARFAALSTATVFVLAAASFGRQPATPDAADPTGKYTLRDGGYLVVSVDDLGRVEGFYERNGEFGRLGGRLESGVVSASWVQKSGPQTCNSAMDGQLHWGGLTMTRTQAGELDLAWGACGAPPSTLETAR